jgi:hypothetical protein
MERVKEFAKKHKYKLVAAGAATAGLIAVACGVKKAHEIGLWDNIVPFNTTDTVVCVRKWTGSDEHNGSVLVGLREVPIAKLTEVATEAFSKADLGEDTIVEQVILSTIKEKK